MKACPFMSSPPGSAGDGTRRTQGGSVSAMDQIKGSKRRGPTAKPRPAPAPTSVRTPSSKKTKAPIPLPVVEPAAVPALDAGVDDTETWVNRRASAQATRAANARQASGRRRFVDPTTCEREYSMAEIEFMQAMHDYKQSSGRMFPTWSEVLEVIKALGYEKALGLPALIVPGGAKTGRTA
jgi:hypothetical protein